MPILINLNFEYTKTLAKKKEKQESRDNEK